MMKRSFALVMVLCWLSASSAFAALHEYEVWRSARGTVRSLVIGPDGTLWASMGSRVVHFAANGSVAAKYDLWRPSAVAPGGLGFWVIDQGYPVFSPDYPTIAVWSYTDAGLLFAASPEVWAPMDLATFGDGTVWVFEPWGLTRLNSAGNMPSDPNMVTSIGLSHEASDMSLAPSGQIWVSFFTGFLAAHFNPQDREHTFIWEGGLVTSGDEPGETHVAAAGDGSGWLTQRDPGLLLHFSAGGGGVERDRFAGFAHPRQVVDGGDGSVWVADDTGLIHVDGTGTRMWRETGDTPPPLPVPTSDLISGGDGSVWVARTGDGWPGIIHYSAAGNVLWKLGDSLSFPSAAARAGDFVWVADTENNRLVCYGADGTRAGQSAATSHLEHPDFVLCDPAGSVLANDRGTWDATVGGYVNPAIVRFGADGTELWRSASTPETQRAGLRVAAMNSVASSFWVAYEGFRDTIGVDHVPMVVRFRSDGTEAMRYTGSFVTPLSLAVNSRDGSCWLAAVTNAEDGTGELIHIAANGLELARVLGEETQCPYAVAVNQTDGSVWTLLQSGEVAKLTSTGVLMWREPGYGEGLAVDSAADRAWLTSGEQIVILSTLGVELYRGDGFLFQHSTPGVNDDDHTCWVPDTGNSQLVHVSVPFTLFEDIPVKFWAAKQIDACARADVVRGYADGSFRPEQVITRDQMAVFLARAIAGDDTQVPPGPASPSFSDVPTDYWAYRHIEYLRTRGVANGYADGKYGPKVEVTRAHMAVFLARAIMGGEANVPPGPQGPSYFDVTPDFWAYKHIELITSLGIAVGYPDNRFHPEFLCTRGQMAVFVAKAFTLI